MLGVAVVRACTHLSQCAGGDRGAVDRVVVQLMVGADQSGVVFTADPRTGARDRIVVEAATGLGEVVVGGQVEPDTYVVAKSGFAVIDAHIGSQSFSITADAEGQHSVEIPATARGRRVLTDQQLERLALLAVAVEDHYHVPQDLEFVFDADRLWIVQTRPITTLDKPRTHTEQPPNRRTRSSSTASAQVLERRPAASAFCGPYPMLTGCPRERSWWHP